MVGRDQRSRSRFARIVYIQLNKLIDTLLSIILSLLFPFPSNSRECTYIEGTSSKIFLVVIVIIFPIDKEGFRLSMMIAKWSIKKITLLFLKPNPRVRGFGCRILMKRRHSIRSVLFDRNNINRTFEQAIGEQKARLVPSLLCWYRGLIEHETGFLVQTLTRIFIYNA